MIFYHPAKQILGIESHRSMYRPVLINNTICDNSASDHSGAIYLNCVSNVPVMFNNIFYDNLSGNESIIYNNSPSDTLIVSYSNIDETKIIGTWVGEENINEDPLFIDSENGNYHLDILSPCICQATDSIEVESMIFCCPINDFEGNIRPSPQTGTLIKPDIGAFEEMTIECPPVAINESAYQKPTISVFPNPSGWISDIRYQISDIRFVSLEVFDIHGQKINTMVHEKQAAGEYVVQFDGTGLAPGLYFLRLNVGNEVENVKVLIM